MAATFDPELKDVNVTSELLNPCDSPVMRCYSISNRINLWGTESAKCWIVAYPASSVTTPYQDSKFGSLRRELFVRFHIVLRAMLAEGARPHLTVGLQVILDDKVSPHYCSRLRRALLLIKAK
jgi:hypothetical protein